MENKYDIVFLPHFVRDVKRLKRKHIDLNSLETVLNLLHIQSSKNVQYLKERYKDHALKGNNSGFRELHLKPNILIKYQLHKQALVLVLVKLGSHQYVLK